MCSRTYGVEVTVEAAVGMRVKLTERTPHKTRFRPLFFLHSLQMLIIASSMFLFSIRHEDRTINQPITGNMKSHAFQGF